MNNDSFHCSPSNIIPEFHQDSSDQQRDSSFHEELILNRAAAIPTSWAPLEQQDYSYTSSSEESLEKSSTLHASLFENHTQPWMPRRRITPPPPSCYDDQEQGMDARIHDSNQHHQQVEDSFSLKNDEDAITSTHKMATTANGHAIDSSNDVLLEPNDARRQPTALTPIFPDTHDPSIQQQQQQQLPFSSPHVVYTQGESTSFPGASPLKMSILFAAASSVEIKQDNATTVPDRKETLSMTTQETQQEETPPAAKKGYRRGKSSKKTTAPKSTVQEKNAAIRARSAEKRNRIAFIRNIPANERTHQEQQELKQQEARKLKKSLQSKQRLALENTNLARIQALAPEQRTMEDTAFMAKICARKQHKNQVDRQRRQRLKQAKEKAQLAAEQQWQVFVPI